LEKNSDNFISFWPTWRRKNNRFLSHSDGKECLLKISPGFFLD
jgi:hypothetical protein